MEVLNGGFWKDDKTHGTYTFPLARQFSTELDEYNKWTLIL